MKIIIKHGNVPKYKTKCEQCGCIFEYEKVDTHTSSSDYGISYLLNKYVDCSCCCAEITHRETNFIDDEN